MNEFKHDEEVILKIKEGNQKVIRQLHSDLKSSFKKYFFSKNVDEDTALDIYNQSFTIFYQNVQSGKIQPPLKSTIKTYLHGIGKNLLMQFWEKSKKTRYEPLDDVLKSPEIFDFYHHQEQKEFVRALLLSLDDSCRKILELSFIKGYSDNAIMTELGLSNENAVRQKKFRCLDKIRKLVVSKKPNL